MGSAGRLRPVHPGDSESVRTIFNYYVAHSFAAYAEHPLSAEDIQLMLAATDGYPAYAVEDERDGVIGFSFLRPYSSHATFAGTVCITTFIAAEHTGKGLGSALLARIESAARDQGISHILAHVSSLNEGSLAFHQRHGYATCGCFNGIGCKHGQTFDVVWFEKTLQKD